jgi:LysW-gamma-L-lysine carboxypeptidase
MTDDQGPRTANRGNYATLIGLVEQYSPSGEETGAVNWLVSRMRTLGFTQAFVDGTGNAVGVMGTGEKQIVLLGHIDTVPGKIEVCVSLQDNVIARRPASGLTKQSPPDDERLLRSARNEILFGRGSVDAKGPLAAFVDAVATVGPVEGWQFVVIGAIDEERDSIGARGIVASEEYKPDFAIIGEPSQWDRVTLGYKGTAWAEVVVRRSMAHTAGQAESAPEAAVDFWNQVIAWATEFNADRERAFEQVLPTLRGFSSGGDGFEETATLKIGVRLPTDLDPPQWYDQLRALGFAADIEISPTGFSIPAYRAERNTPLVRAFLGGIRAAGGKPGFVVKTGTADLNIVAPVWKCPAVAYGPGDSSLDHTPNEHLSLAEYEKAVKVLTEVLGRLSA